MRIRSIVRDEAIMRGTMLRRPRAVKT